MIWNRIKTLTRILRKICEYHRIRQILGVNLLSVFVLLAQISSPTFASQNIKEEELIVLPATTVSLLTQTSFQKPLEGFRLSQGFYRFHQGIDLAAPRGSAVRPILAGIVEEKEFSRFAYGNSLVINHGSGLKSRYAHLSKIFVEKGQGVESQTEIGQVGSTGFSTGPHLHLEISHNDQLLNPRTVLGL